MQKRPFCAALYALPLSCAPPTRSRPAALAVLHAGSTHLQPRTLLYQPGSPQFLKVVSVLQPKVRVLLAGLAGGSCQAQHDNCCNKGRWEGCAGLLQRAAALARGRHDNIADVLFQQPDLQAACHTRTHLASICMQCAVLDMLLRMQDWT